MEIKDDGSNPLIIISPKEVVEWLRSKADESGYADRASVAVQTTFRQNEPPQFFIEPPELIIMVSNIKNSR